MKKEWRSDMKNKQLKWKFKLTRLGMLPELTLLAFIIWGSSASGQALHINSNNDEQITYNLSTIRKMTFSSGNLTVTKSDKSTDLYILTELRQLSFFGYPTVAQKINEEVVSLHAYPNPVSTNLHITLPEPGKIQILSLDGKLVLTMQITSSGITSIPVNHLEAGIYICLYTNGQESKTLKIIKQ